MMVAALVCFFTKTRRSVDFRQKAYLLLKCMIEAVCGLGADLIATHVDLDGNEIDHNFRVEGSPLVDAMHLWDDNFYLTHLADGWAQDLNDSNIPWISSPGTRPHLADWLAFCLDLPQTETRRNVRHYSRRVLIDAKKAYAGSALGIVTQIADVFNSNIIQCTESVGTRMMHDDKGHFYLLVSK